jgi:hypothetical protein
MEIPDPHSFCTQRNVRTTQKCHRVYANTQSNLACAYKEIINPPRPTHPHQYTHAHPHPPHTHTHTHLVMVRRAEGLLAPTPTPIPTSLPSPTPTPTPTWLPMVRRAGGSPDEQARRILLDSSRTSVTDPTFKELAGASSCAGSSPK